MGSPVLVHTRIEKNHRRTIILLALVPVVLLPYAGGVAVWLAPVVAQEAISIGPAAIAFFGLELTPPWGELRLVLMTAGMVATGMTVVTFAALVLYRQVILGRTSAKLLAPDEEPDLERVVEGLCVGAGVPVPRLYVIESAVPNAFATGRDPAHATLTVTRGLLTLLTRRELAGVVAHELAHIVNHDSRLNTVVAALVATLRLPVAVVTTIYRLCHQVHQGFGLLFLLGFFTLFIQIAVFAMLSLFFGIDDDGPLRWVRWREMIMSAFCLFSLFGPFLGLFIRQAVSRQREYLADAEAVMLTRDPEALALALTKIGAWRGPGRLALGPSASHLCIVDPVPFDALWCDRIFPYHPPISERVRLLIRMAPGIDESLLRSAAHEGAKAGQLAAAAPEPKRPTPAPAPEPEAPSPEMPSSIPLYEKPDGWSTVLCQLPEHAAVIINGREGNFLRVTTANRIVGYISESSRARVIVVPRVS